MNIIHRTHFRPQNRGFKHRNQSELLLGFFCSPFSSTEVVIRSWGLAGWLGLSLAIKNTSCVNASVKLLFQSLYSIFFKMENNFGLKLFRKYFVNHLSFRGCFLFKMNISFSAAFIWAEISNKQISAGGFFRHPAEYQKMDKWTNGQTDKRTEWWHHLLSCSSQLKKSVHFFYKNSLKRKSRLKMPEA